MIRIQKLIEPKKTSGKKLSPGVEIKVQGVMIKNTSKNTFYVDTYERKKPAPKVVKDAQNK